MNNRATFVATPPGPLEPPVNPMTLPTAGSSVMTPTTACSLCCIAWNDVSCAAWMAPVSRPLSCCGKNPFGTIANR